MIDVLKQTPAEYGKQSRDYQVLCRLYTALYNLNKMYIDNMHYWGGNIDNKLSTLRSKTLNFSPKHEWDPEELDAAISCFKYIMMKKGSRKAIQYCLTILMRIKKLSGSLYFGSMSEKGTLSIDDNHLTIQIEDSLADVGVIEDLLNYILPAGITYRIITFRKQDTQANTKVYFEDGDTEYEGILNKNMGIYNNESETSESSNRGRTLYQNMVGENINS